MGRVALTIKIECGVKVKCNGRPRTATQQNRQRQSQQLSDNQKKYFQEFIQKMNTRSHKDESEMNFDELLNEIEKFCKI